MAQNERFGIDVVLNDAQFRSGVSRMVSELNRTSRGAQDAGSSGKQMGISFTNAFKAAAGATAVVAGIEAIKKGFSAVVKTGMDYTKQMSTVEAISGATSVQMAELGSNARKLGAETKWSATNVAEAYEYMATAGWNSNQMLDASLGLLNLATAGALDLGRAADIVTDTMTPFGLAAKEAGHVSDVFATAGAAANLNVEQLGETMKYAAPIAATFGASLEDTTAVAMQFANGGIKASMAGTALRAGLSRLAAPPKAAADALDSMNISTRNSDNTMKSLGQIIGEMSPKFNALTNAQQVATAKAIFGEEAYAGWILTLKGGSTEFEKFKNQLVQSDGAAEAMAKVMANNLSGAMANASSAAENLGLILFSRIEGGLTAATNGSIGFMESLSKSIDPMNNIVEATKLLQVEQQKQAMSEAAIKANLDNGIITREVYNERMAETERKFLENTTSSGIFKQKLVELDAQLASGQLTQDEYNKKKQEAEGFSLNMAKAVEQEQQKQAELGEKIKWLQGIFDQLWKFIEPLWNDMSNFIGEQVSKIKKFIDENGKEIETVWNAVWTVIKFFTESIWEGIKDIISGAIDIIMGIIQVFGGILNGDWEKVWEGVKNIVGGALDVIWGIIEVGFGKLLKAPLKLGEDLLKWAGKTFKNLGKDIGKYIDDIVRGGSEGWQKFLDDAGRIMGKIWDTIKDPIGTAKRMLEGIDWGDVGRNLVQSLIDGIWGMTKWLSSTVSSVGSMLNPLKWFRGADAPFNTGGGMMQSPMGEGGLAALPSGGGFMQAPSGGGGLSQVMSAINDSMSQLSAVSSAGSKGGHYSRMVDLPQGSDARSGKLVVEVPVYLDKYQIASATGEVTQRELGRLDSRTTRGSTGSKYF